MNVDSNSFGATHANCDKDSDINGTVNVDDSDIDGIIDVNDSDNSVISAIVTKTVYADSDKDSVCTCTHAINMK